MTPGFIDLHAHGQSVPADRMQAFDGVTTSLELELGSLPMVAWYEQQATSGGVINYGTSVAWAFARIAAMTGTEPQPSIGFMGRMMKDRRWADNVATNAKVEAILARTRAGLQDGGIGIDIPNAYAPGAGVKEMSEVCSLAAEHGVPTYTHIAFMSNVDPQSSIEASTRLIGYAGSTGAHMHICHFNSASLQDVERASVLVCNAQRQGLPVTVEAYPYGTGSTVLGAGFFADPDFNRRTGTLAPDLVRAKGILEFREQPGRPMLFQLAGRRTMLGAAPPEKDRQAAVRLVLIAERGQLDTASARSILAGCEAVE
jgi:N-acyl-D-glutamate deacylase